MSRLVVSAAGSILAAGHFQQVVAELSLYRTLNGVDWRAEHDSVEFLDHLAWAERTQITALAAGRAAGVGFGDFSEISAAFDLSLEFVAFIFARNKDVAGSCFRHGKQSPVKKRNSVPDSVRYFPTKFLRFAYL
ncbi:Succinate dehydrogenase/fumarate reductase [Pseudomonas syringae pv. actinidiae]|nr:Succinate dehydrogenase/fumarate reductase [Pseudomonas syringae pv. actinidiae]